MIIHSYDESEPLISPRDFYGPQKHLCETCILTFSHVIFSELKRMFPLREAAIMGAANGGIPIYLFEYGGKTLAACLCGIGATQAGTNTVEINWLTGAEKFIMFGSAGSLDRAATQGKFVIPTEAYRDEGISYHYAPPADYIQPRPRTTSGSKTQTALPRSLKSWVFPRSEAGSGLPTPSTGRPGGRSQPVRRRGVLR